jgi:DUF1680 family protein
VADASYRSATEFFVETLALAHSYSTGGSNFREYWHDAATTGSAVFSAGTGGGGALGDPFAGHDTEESCTTYNFLKILRHLFRWSQDPAGSSGSGVVPGILDMYAHAITNGVQGIQRPGAPGVMLYLLPLGNGVTKGNSSRGWGTPLNSFWCCYGQYVTTHPACD